MRIETVYIKGFRNYCDAVINFNETNLIIGANDVGKTNLLYAIRLLLDKSLSELDLEPKSNDFHVNSTGEQVENIEITIKFTDVSEDAVISKLGGYVSDEGETYIKYLASSLTMDYKILL
ncbi:TPA: AAA family ATPase, partial [Escherichia coli]